MTDPTDQVAKARQWALYYRERGYQPLPSEPDRKKPMLSTFAEYWELPLPETILKSWHAPNVQLMTGAAWKLLVVDCDGDRAQQVWATMCADRGHFPWTWTIRTGSGGVHYYYALPEGTLTCQTRRIWGLWDTYAGLRHEGEWIPHHEIRILGDRALVVAPPSLHVETREPYTFLCDFGPEEMAAPMLAPVWLLELPPLDRPRFTPPFSPRPPSADRGESGPYPEREAVLQAVGPIKHLVAAQYGLRLAARGPNHEGWVSCRAIDREDQNPSASIHHETGVYVDFQSRQVLSFFDLVARLGSLGDWRDAIRDLGAVHGLHPSPRPEFQRSS